MIIVHGFPAMPPLASPSPFCLKLETWLRLAQIPYEARGDYNPFGAPKGKAPYVTLPDGTVLGDSTAIIEQLGADPACTLDDGMTLAESARSTLLQRTIENHLYYALLYFRWHREAGFTVLRQAYFGGMPIPQRWMIPTLARRGVRRTLHLEGTSRHAEAEVLASATADLDALANVIGAGPFVLGEHPRTIDATVFGLLGNIHLGPFSDGLQRAVRERPTLVDYVEHVHGVCWGDGMSPSAG